MSKRPLGKSTNSKTSQANTLADTQKENTGQFIETATEQFADLLWKCWLVGNSADSSKTKQFFSGKNTGSTESHVFPKAVAGHKMRVNSE